MKKAAFQLLPILLFLTACGNGPGQQTANNSGASATDPNLPPATYLEGVYATSTEAGKGIENLFDSNPNTFWQTRAGTGSDEGIMLYFQEPLSIASVAIMVEEGIAVDLPEQENPILIYTNGQVANNGKPGVPIGVSQNGLVKSLFVRFPFTGAEFIDHKILREGVSVVISSGPADKFISISEIKVINDKGQALRLIPPQSLKGFITASSTLAPESAYSPANLFDSRKEFVWVEGSASSGEGEELTFEFEHPLEITAIQIWNGYQRADEHFAANARVHDFDFGAKGSIADAYSLQDAKAGQKIELKTPVKGSAFSLKVKSVYPGKSYKDLAISDIVFFNGAQPFVLHSTLPEKYQAALQAKAAGSPIAPLLDKYISNHLTEDETDKDLFYTANSLILRSDGTFVYYNDDSSGGNLDVSSLADGNWEILSGSQVKVFGQWTDLVNWPEYYEGNSQKSPTRIFKDVLTISDSKVEGSKMIGKILLK